MQPTSIGCGRSTRSFPPGIAYSQMELTGFIHRRNAITLVAESLSAEPEDRIAGFVVAHPIRRKYGRILTLDIVPQARRSGLATQLMNACEDRLRSLGCNEVYLETAVDNEPALRLYRKLGMKCCAPCRSITAATASTRSRWANGYRWVSYFERQNNSSVPQGTRFILL